MMQIEDIKKDLDLLNNIDWDMTPEEAVTLYLEWGNNWSHSKYVIKSKNDFSYYFVINTWKEPVIYFIKRNSEEAVELAKIDIPSALKDDFMESIGHLKGVQALTGKIKEWLQEQLNY